LRRKIVSVVGASALLVAAGCGAPDGAKGGLATADAKQPVVYGVDNRQDVPQHSDASLRRLAEASTLTLVLSGSINESNPNNITFPGPNLGQARNLCATERFRDDPTAGNCSGTLIANDLVLTAGHCISSATCADNRFVFGYRREANGAMRTVTSADVFRCSAVVARELTSTVDYAVVRLDRAATPRFTVAPVRTQATVLDVGQRVTVIGSPSGILHKIDSGGSVRDARASTLDYFVANTDTFGGNSGSGVYENDSYQLSGILVRGETDYVANGNCNIVNVCTESGCQGEDITYVHRAIQGLCAAEPAHYLCNPRRELVYSATNTTSAQQNTYNRFVFVEPGQSIDYGTCIVPGSAGSGDTYLRLFAPWGVEVSANDDFSGCGLLSRATYTSPSLVGALYEIRAGCYSAGSCSGTVAYTTNGPDGGKFTYDATNTNHAQQNTRNVMTVPVRQGDTLIAGTCGVEHAAFTGDTFLRLFSGGGLVAANDDACGLGSRLSYTATANGTLEIRAGCYSSGSCTGTVAFTIVPGGTYAYSAADTNSAQQNTVNRSIELGAGDSITVGTCGLPGATFTGDTYLRIFNGATQVALNDDACGGLGSQLTYTAAASASYQVRAGCYSGSSCSGNVVYTIVRKGTGSGQYAYSAANTASATQNTVNQALFLKAGQVVNMGTCGVAGSAGTGDTYLRLLGPDSVQAVANDDACGGLLSNILFTVPAGREGSYEIRGGCYSSGSCTGTVPYREQ
jgi:V8-like Glu-specific endopeptidase